MKKCEVLKNLTFETCKQVRLFVYPSSESTQYLEGVFNPLDAMRLVHSLPPKFVYGYICIV